MTAFDIFEKVVMGWFKALWLLMVVYMVLNLVAGPIALVAGIVSFFIK